MNIVVFCGGRGSSALIQELIRWPEVQITLIVNAYDDGLSTGAIRRAIPGFLGPSDFRKNMVTTLLQSGEQHLAIAELFEFRLPVELAKGASTVTDMAEVCEEFSNLWLSLNDYRKNKLKGYIETFLQYNISESIDFSFLDCAIGNLIYAGAFLQNGRDFQKASDALCHLLGVNARIISVSNDSTHLVGLLSDGTYLPDEASIVSLTSDSRIKEIFLLKEPLSLSEIQTLSELPLQNKIDYLHAASFAPQVNTSAIESLRTADLVIYGSGTQHSSLFPSYLVLSNHVDFQRNDVPRVFICNLDWDHDIRGFTLNDLLQSFKNSWKINELPSHVSHILIDESSVFNAFGQDDLCLDGAEVIVGNYRNIATPTKHSGYALFKQLQEILNDSGNRTVNRKIQLSISLTNSQKRRQKPLQVELSEIDWRGNLEFSFHFSDSTERQLTTQFANWYQNSNQRYFVGLTGHGQYALGDIASFLDSRTRSDRKTLYIGNRFESRNLWILARRTAFEERHINQFIAQVGAILLNLLIYVRFQRSVADPFSKVFIIDREFIEGRFENSDLGKLRSILDLYRLFWKSSNKTGEFPIKFRATFGESASFSHLVNGVKELWRFLW